MSKLSDATLDVLKAAILVVESYGDELEISHVGMISHQFSDLVKHSSGGKLDNQEEMFSAEELFMLGSVGDLEESRFTLAFEAAESKVQS